MNYFLTLLIWFFGLGTPPSAADHIVSQQGKYQVQETNGPKNIHHDITGGTSIIVIIDDTEYRPVK